jgi:hypothetical protein
LTAAVYFRAAMVTTTTSGWGRRTSKAGEFWQRLEFAFDDFRLWRRGQMLSAEVKIDLRRIGLFGLLTASKQAGNFSRDVGWVAEHGGAET